MKRLLVITLLLLQSTLSSAQDREDYYGGWIAEVDDVSHVLHIVLRDDRVSGFYCHDCARIDNLAFVDDGRLDASGLAFFLYHYPPDAEPYRETVNAVRRGDGLHVTRQREGSNQPIRQTVYRRQVPDPALDLLPVNAGPPADGEERLMPGPAEVVSPDNLLGTWLWGAGPGKQIFMFRAHKGGVRGMVCGPCDRLDAMAPLEKISYSGVNLHFEIVHENSGAGFAEHGSHSNVTDAVISEHEMHMDVVPSFEHVDTFDPIRMTLLGPVR